MPRNGNGGISANQLDLAVLRGVISAEQREQLLAIEGAAPQDASVETPRGLNLVTVGYWAGSAAVLFALGWFLVDRWKSLRPAGVLAVALLYAISFGLSALLLSRLGFRLAAALLTLLTVGMTPIVTWAVESLLGMWPDVYQRSSGPFSADLLGTIRWIPIELTTALAALIALRKVRFGLLVLAVTIPMGLAWIHLTPWLFDPELNFALWGWMAMFASAVMLSAGYAAERRRQGDAEDYAAWIYLTALGFLVISFVAVAGQSRTIPHALPLLIALLVTLALSLARKVFLLAAAIFFVGYLGFLASNVFKGAVGFMLVMLAAGAVLILLTVVAQRRFPSLVRRLSAEGRAAHQPPRAVRLLFPAMVVLALVLVIIAVPRARAQQRAKYQQLREFNRQAGEGRRARQAAERSRSREPLRGETPTLIKP